MLDKEKVLTILKDVNFPGFTRDIVSFGIVKNVDFIENKTLIYIELPKEDEEVANIKHDDFQNFDYPATSPEEPPPVKLHEDIETIIELTPDEALNLSLIHI